ncbi:putative protein [Drosophila innubila nudivirus]|uniref:Uncharacterized protein n=1 Tax=Drosophila innubila nudivirus TaxID=2057187 RepID=A0A2H4UXE8_9VIRU|nr:putative protein [Drosophila innubila nudivirus]ATZ81586.1 putative protein [Drosophila innubila nudivirus]
MLTKNHKIVQKSLKPRRYNPILKSNPLSNNELSDINIESHPGNLMVQRREISNPINVIVPCNNNNDTDHKQFCTTQGISKQIEQTTSAITPNQFITTQSFINELSVNRPNDSMDIPNDASNNHINNDDDDDDDINPRNRRQKYKTTRQILNKSKQLFRKTRKPLLSMASGFGLYMITNAYSGIIKSYIPISPQFISTIVFTAVEAITKSIC